MKKEYVVKKESEIKKVFNGRNHVRNTFFGVWYIKNDLNHFRYCLTIGKKYGNAVTRVLMKRRLRDIILHIEDKIKVDIDFIIVVYPESNVLNYQEIKDNINKLMSKIKIVEVRT
jgi:ribonuclease P protein component